MRKYYRLKLGIKNVYAEQCFRENFIGIDFDISKDLTNKLPEAWRDFNKEFIPVYLQNHPDKTKIAAGLACGNAWVVAKGIMTGDIVICTDESGSYHAGEVTSDYFYAPGQILPHRRSIRWYSQSIERDAISESLSNSLKFGGSTVIDISRHQAEIDQLIGEISLPVIISTDPIIQDPAAFVMEKHLEDFLIQNWAQTELSQEFEIYEEDGEKIGQQYPTDTGPLDILAISKDKKRLLVIELKKGKASDVVVGQVLRYMGYVKDVLAEQGQTVSGAIIALEDDQRIRRALAVVPSINFYRYQISFKLLKS
jgi:restriction system protein